MKAIRDFCAAFVVIFGNWTDFSGGLAGVAGLIVGIALEPRCASSVAGFVVMVVASGLVALRAGRRYIELERKLQPRIVIHCGEENPNTMGRNRPVRSVQMIVDFFGIWIVNEGTKAVKNFEIRLVALEKDGVVVCDHSAGLAFEAQNQGDDIPSVSLRHNIPEKTALCSVNDKGEVMFGSCNFRWRHSRFQNFFPDHGEYVFCLKISADEMETRDERFVFDWKGTRQDSTLRYLKH